MGSYKKEAVSAVLREYGAVCAEKERLQEHIRNNCTEIHDLKSKIYKMHGLMAESKRKLDISEDYASRLESIIMEKLGYEEDELKEIRYKSERVYEGNEPE